MQWMRTLHIYATLFGLVLVIFFSFTGFMLNHEEWFHFKSVRIIEHAGKLDPGQLQGADDRIDRLAIENQLRRDLGAVGLMDSFTIEPDRILIAFNRAGVAHCDAEISRATGQAKVTIESNGLMGVMADLHKAPAYTGLPWRVIVDVTAILMIFGAVSGLVLWFTLPKRRRLGLIALVGGGFVGILVYIIWVP